jgi:hypothetical protein
MSMKMKRSIVIPDGNTEIADEITQIMGIIARTSRWVHPDVFRELPVWAPWAARGRPLYDRAWQRHYTNTKRGAVHAAEKYEGNRSASQVLFTALGVANPKPLNWTVCHIWGYDDPGFKSQGSIVRDPRFFTCVANMIWLPTALKGFTDAIPEIKTMLRTCAYYLYGWTCEHPTVEDLAKAIRGGVIPPGYPLTWPAPGRRDVLPPGTAPITPTIRSEIRKAKLIRLLDNMNLTHFPRDEVRQVLSYWRVNL